MAAEENNCASSKVRVEERLKIKIGKYTLLPATA